MTEKFTFLVSKFLDWLPYIFVGVTTMSILTSLTFFNPKPLQNNFITLDSEQKAMLNGEYEVFPHRTFDKKGAVKGLYFGSSKNNIVGILSGREDELEVSEKATMFVNFVNNETVAISIWTESKELFHKEYKGKFKRNGFFYFDQKLFSSIGFPFIAGGFHKYKSRLGLSKHGSLIIQTAESNIGTMLLVIRKSRREHLVYHFRKIYTDIKV